MCVCVCIKQGMTHPFVFEFASEEDRDYYVDTDPAHIAFKEGLAGLVDKVHVYDFTAGSF